MASFTDEIVQFNPYIKDFATDAYVTAGMYKQQKYTQNLQKVNAYVESLYGLPVARDVDKQYLHSKINSFTEGINKFLSSADFSNDSIVNQVGGYAGQIANDRIVQNAVQSSTRLQKDISALELAKKEGKGYSPANEFHLMKSVNAYMTGDLETSYQSEGYIPAIDANDEIQKLWKDKHPNARLEKRVGLDGSSGWVMLTEQGEKAISQEEVMREIESTIDPRLRKQLSIDGSYKLHGIDTDTYIDGYFKEGGDYLDELIKSTNAQLLTADSETKKLLQQQLNKAVEDKKQLKTTIVNTKMLAQTNPDQVKDQLYYQQWLRGTSSRLSYSDTKLENVIYKDYYDIMNTWYDNLTKRMGAGKDGKTPEGLGGTLVERPITEAQAEGVSLEGIRKEVIDTKSAMDADWNELAGNLLADNYEAAGLSKEAQDLRDANRQVYFDKDGRFISPSTYMALPKEQQKLYSKGNFARNQVMSEGIAQNIYTVRNKSVLDGLKRQLEKEYYEGNPNLPIEVKEYFDRNIAQEKVLAAKAQAISQIDNQIKREGLVVENYEEIMKRQKAKEQTQRRTLSNPYVSSPIHVAADDPEYSARVKAREQRESELVRGIQGAFNERVRVLEKGKPEDARNISQIITTISGINKESGQDRFRGIEWDDVQAMIAGKDRENTAFSYGQVGATGEPFVEITNPVYNKGKAIRIPLDRVTAQTMGLYENDPLSTAKQIMDLKGGTTGNSPAEALPILNGGKYRASYHVTRLQSGNYKLKLYLAAPGLQNGQVEFIDNTKAYSEAELGQILQSVNDSSIENYIRHKQAVELGRATENPQIKPFNTVGPAAMNPLSSGIPTFPGIPSMINQ